MSTEDKIIIHGARQNNLKNIDIEIPKNKLVVITGPSGSGKSSLAFDTLYTEGQRRYVESLSAYARQFLNIQSKPDVDYIGNLSPAIAIDQKTSSKNPRSTVATVTEIYDYLRVLFARIGVPYSPATGLPIVSQTSSQMIQELLELPNGTKMNILAPVIRGQKGEHKKLLIALRKQGYQRVRLNGEYMSIDDAEIDDKNRKNNVEIVVDRIEITPDIKERLASSIENALGVANGLVYADIQSFPMNEDGETTEEFKFKNGKIANLEHHLVYSEKFSCPISGFVIEDLEPRIFSFNSPYGACGACNGLGKEQYFMKELIIPDEDKSINDGCIAPWENLTSNKLYYQVLGALAKHYGFSTRDPWKSLPEKIQQIILYGNNGEEVEVEYSDGLRKSKMKRAFEGVINILDARLRETESEAIREEIAKFQDETYCHVCHGYRLQAPSLAVKIAGKNIGEVCFMTIEESIKWFENLIPQLTEQQQEIGERPVKEIIKRLYFLHNVGLDYLTLAREAKTLSGGESQRIRLASQIGSELTGIMYVLDEPSIGLHQSDNEKLIKTLKHLRDIGNTVIVVEHDEETMMAADMLIDIGPVAGEGGGYIVACGTPQEVMENPDSITGKYLSGKERIEGLHARRRGNPEAKITIKGARSNNLKNIDVDFPLGKMVCVTGVSGCGKSSLVMETLYRAVAKRLHSTSVKPGLHTEITGLEYIDKIIEIDQSPIGRTPRSNPATYTACFTHIRDWFTNLPEAKRRGYKSSRFSFNVKGGRCEACQGDGIIKVEMHFLPDVYVECEVCKGKRYNKETLEVKYKGKSICDVLEMSIGEAYEFFKPIDLIATKLKYLVKVGLDYMKLGQPATTLSGGESQRIKLARELSKKDTGNTLYILDEPTTGLHSCDIKKLLEVIQQLVDQGNSMVIIEHNMDVIKTADWIIDIGPKGGVNGGTLVACGTPEDVSKVEESITGQYLKKYLIK
jgi:excinuclease ABC subunit A